MRIFKISEHLVNYFKNENKISSGRVYVVIQLAYSGNIHSHQFEELANILGLKLQTVKKHINYLERKGLITEVPNVKGWYKLTGKKIFNPTKARKRSIEVDLDHIINDGFKYLRSVFYNFLYKRAYKVAQKNQRAARKENQSVKATRLGNGFYPTSASFVKAVTYTNHSEKTLLKHLKRAAKYGLIWSFNNFISFKHKTYEDMINHFEDLRQDSDHWKFRKYKDNYLVYRYGPNLIRFDF